MGPSRRTKGFGGHRGSGGPTVAAGVIAATGQIPVMAVAAQPRPRPAVTVLARV